MNKEVIHSLIVHCQWPGVSWFSLIAYSLSKTYILLKDMCRFVIGPMSSYISVLRKSLLLPSLCPLPIPKPDRLSVIRVTLSFPAPESPSSHHLSRYPPITWVTTLSPSQSPSSHRLNHQSPPPPPPLPSDSASSAPLSVSPIPPLLRQFLPSFLKLHLGNVSDGGRERRRRIRLICSETY